ncbi:hypothetical protein ABZP36_001991, partial [Zizania latifolia]
PPKNKVIWLPDISNLCGSSCSRNHMGCCFRSNSNWSLWLQRHFTCLAIFTLVEVSVSISMGHSNF